MSIKNAKRFREEINELISHINTTLMPCRERSTALTKLEEARMWLREYIKTDANRAQNSV